MITNNDVEKIKDALQPEFDKLADKIDSLEKRTGAAFKKTEDRFDSLESNLKRYIVNAIAEFVETIYPTKTV
ncbi:MAG: hypothetical protein G01um101416_1186 [Microgenomates group bacterium Gr01-1014_16]|nr:MAG: hypothetical protein G01um101416_1186 [Microgenomates group bacterium Gr01-1014_16]